MKDVDAFDQFSDQLGGASSVLQSDISTQKQPHPLLSLRETLGLDSLKTSRVLPAFPAIIGHRGAPYFALENTIQAFQKCANVGAAGVELDVFTLKDGSIIVFHGSGTDEDPGYCEGYCLGKEGVNIVDLTYQQVQELRFNPNNSEFPCPTDSITTAKIPLLSQVLETLRGTGLEIKIELKGPNTVKPVVELVDVFGMTGQCSYSSFDHAKLKELRDMRPSPQLYPTGALFNKVPKDFIEQARNCGATEVHFRYDTCTVDYVRAARTAGFRTMAWLRGPTGMASDCQQVYRDLDSGEDEACYRALWETGVDQICCNLPDVALKMCGKKENYVLPNDQQLSNDLTVS